MSKGVFITGTDTGIGKTWFTITLMHALKLQNRRTLGMKPIASGAELIDGRLINDDARLILDYCSEPIAYDLINPVIFEAPIAPGFASELEQNPIDMNEIDSAYKKLLSKCENIVVEGAGGWRVPLSKTMTTVDLVRQLDLPVILVVGLRLGCVNHALLTAEAIRADGLNLCGWVSNQVENDYLQKEQTMSLLNTALNCPNIADLPYMQVFDRDKTAKKIDPAFIIEQTS